MARLAAGVARHLRSRHDPPGAQLAGMGLRRTAGRADGHPGGRPAWAARSTGSERPDHDGIPGPQGWLTESAARGSSKPARRPNCRRPHAPRVPRVRQTSPALEALSASFRATTCNRATAATRVAANFTFGRRGLRIRRRTHQGVWINQPTTCMRLAKQETCFGGTRCSICRHKIRSTI